MRQVLSKLCSLAGRGGGVHEAGHLLVSGNNGLVAEGGGVLGTMRVSRQAINTVLAITSSLQVTEES